MAYINPTTKARLQARLTTKEAQLTTLETAYDLALESGHIKEYRFDSGDGSQRTEYKSLKEIQDLIVRLETEIDGIYRRLNGTGLVSINVRRKGYGGLIRR